MYRVTVLSGHRHGLAHQADERDEEAALVQPSRNGCLPTGQSSRSPYGEGHLTDRRDDDRRQQDGHNRLPGRLLQLCNGRRARPVQINVGMGGSTAV
jgi:hypothetical protein